MNLPKALELALATMMRDKGLVAGAIIRPWQSLAFDVGWHKKADAERPLVDIRFAPESVDETQHTYTSAGNIILQTKTDDDIDHAIISDMYSRAHGLARGIFYDFINNLGGRYAEFVNLVEDIFSDVVFIGGITLGDATPPESEEDRNAIGFSITIHFSYK